MVTPGRRKRWALLGTGDVEEALCRTGRHPRCLWKGGKDGNTGLPPGEGCC